MTDATVPPAGDAPDAQPEPAVTQHGQRIARIKKFLRMRRIQPDALSGFLPGHNLGTGLATDDIATLFLYDDRHRADPCGKDYVKETLAVLFAEMRRERRREISEFVSRRRTPEEIAAGNLALAEYVEALTGKRDTFTIEVFRHWLWNLKRLALGLATEYDLMPVLYGRKHGSGKSTAVLRFCQPVHELAIKVSAENFTDSRNARVLAEAMIGRWEEMAGGPKAEVEALKTTMSDPSIKYRPMKSNDHIELRRTCQFIGTSNLPVDKIITDTTGARRFVQVDVLSMLDRAAINGIDYGVLYGCVNHDDPAPVNPIMDQLKVHQAELVHRDSISLWLEAETWDAFVYQVQELVSGGGGSVARREGGSGETPSLVGGAVSVPAYDSERGETFEEIAARHRLWCRKVGEVPARSRTLAHRLVELGFEVFRPRLGAGASRQRRYTVPADLLPERPESGPRKVRSPEPQPGEDAFSDGPW